MKTFTSLIFAVAILSTSLSSADSESEYDGERVSEAYTGVTSAGAQTTSMLPISPLRATTITSEGNAGKIIVTAEEDAVFFVAGGAKTARLQQAIEVMRASYQDFESSDLDVAAAILAY